MSNKYPAALYAVRVSGRYTLPKNVTDERTLLLMNDRDLSQKAKDYLNQIQKTNRLIKRLNSTIATLRGRLTSQSYELKPDQVHSSGAKDPIGETFSKISGIETDIQKHIQELYDWEKDALARICRIPDLDQRNVLIARYIENRKWDRIAVEINISKSQVYKIHGTALLVFAEKNPDVLKDDSSME